MRNRLCLVTSNLFFAEVFLSGQIRSFEHSYDVTVVVNATPTEYREAIGGEAKMYNAVRIQQEEGGGVTGVAKPLRHIRCGSGERDSA